MKRRPFNLLLSCFLAFLFFAPAATAQTSPTQESTTDAPPPTVIDLAWQMVEARQALANQLARVADGLQANAQALADQATAIDGLRQAVASINLNAAATADVDLSPVTAKLDAILTALQAASPITATPPPSTTGPINVNTATLAELEALPGIGPALAQRIVTARPYASVEDLAKVRGIGAATLAELGPLVTVTDAPQQEPTTQDPPTGADAGGVTLDGTQKFPHVWTRGEDQDLVLPVTGTGTLKVTITPLRGETPAISITLTAPLYRLVPSVLNQLVPGDYSLALPSLRTTSLLTVK